MGGMLDDSEIRRILVVNAHPDDVDFSAAGTIALWTDAGIEVTYCIVTDGDAGGHDEATLALRKDLARVIRQVRPDRLLSPSPERNYARLPANHPDHRAVGSSALDAVYPDARNPFAFAELRAEEGLEPWTVREVWLPGGPAPNHCVDITASFGRKLAALRAHESQIGQMEGLEEFLRGWNSRVAAQAGLPDGSLAEAFQVIDTA